VSLNHGPRWTRYFKWYSSLHVAFGAVYWNGNLIRIQTSILQGLNKVPMIRKRSRISPERTAESPCALWAQRHDCHLCDSGEKPAPNVEKGSAARPAAVEPGSGCISFWTTSNLDLMHLHLSESSPPMSRRVLLCNYATSVSTSYSRREWCGPRV
jgi:hypothetical protein